jgi:hypothetical protein
LLLSSATIKYNQIRNFFAFIIVLLLNIDGLPR